MTDAQAQQWIDYFATGASFDFHYNMAGLREHLRQDDIAQALAVNIGTMMVSGALTNAGVAACFGQVPAADPVLGISQHGLHLPLFPLVKWEDIAGAWLEGLGMTRARASNGAMIPEVGRVPVAFTPDATTLTLAVRNGRLIRSTATEESPFVDMGMKITRTGSGQEWGELAVYLDPALSPEQVVQFYYLFSLMASGRGIPISHATGMIEGFGAIRSIGDFFRAN